MRIFIGIDLPHETREAAAEHIRVLRRDFSQVRVGWERPEKLHLTLKFLGEITDEQLERLKTAVEKACVGIARFRLSIEGTGVFPNARKPRILWLGVGGNIDALSILLEFIETECEAAGLPREKRKFNPHMTIGRIREPEKGSGLARMHLEQKFEPVEFEVWEVVIFQSKLQSTGSIYEKLYSFTI